MSPQASPPLPPLVVMGVSAVGKTSVGVELARITGARFIDADDLHGAANVEKMRAGIPLTDDDRWPWLDRVGLALQPGVVVACSALRRAYRDRLRASAPETVFVHLVAEQERLQSQAERREGHFMPAGLLQSQLDTLEPLQDDEPGIAVSVDAAPEVLAERARAALPSV